MFQPKKKNNRTLRHSKQQLLFNTELITSSSKSKKRRYNFPKRISLQFKLFITSFISYLSAAFCLILTTLININQPLLMKENAPKCLLITLVLIYFLLSAAIIYFTSSNQDILKEIVNIEMLILIINIIFILFTGLVLILYIYQRCKKQQKVENHLYQPVPPLQTDVILEVEENKNNGEDQEKASIINELNGLKQENEQLAQNINKKQLQNNKLEQKNSELVVVNEDTKYKIEQINKELQQTNDNNVMLQQQMEDMRKDFNSKEARMVSQQRELQFKYEQEMKLLNDKLSNNINQETSSVSVSYEQLKRELVELHRSYEEIEEHRNKLQDRLCDLNPNVLSVDSNFPTVQDIVIKFDTVRTQNRANCSKKIKKYFASQNQDAHKYWLSKQANQLLFTILMNCYQKMLTYLILINKQYKSSINNINAQNFDMIVYHKLRQEFQELFDKIKTGYTNDIIQNAIDLKYNGIYKYCDKQFLIEYTTECLYICWFVVVSQSPPLKLHPTINDDDDDSKNVDTEDLSYEYCIGSEEHESLNYFVWPAIMRTDNDYQLSKIYAFFMDQIPRYSKKAMKRMKIQSQTKDND